MTTPREAIMILKKMLAIAIGTAIMGFGINYFNIANNLAEGGVTGVSIILKLAFDINPGLSVMLLNIPLVLWGLWKLGGKQMLYTIFGTLCLAFFLGIFEGMQLKLDDMLLASLYAGISVGLGMGITFRYGGTTGGVDIIARIMSKHYGWSMGRMMFLADLLVLAVSLVYLDKQQFMYTLVAVFIGSRVIDIVQSGAYRAKALMVISDREAHISSAIMDKLKRGVTLLKARGGYTLKDKQIIYVVCSPRQVVHLKNLIHSVDPNAFITVSDVHEVIGEGFTHDAIEGKQSPVDQKEAVVAG